MSSRLAKKSLMGNIMQEEIFKIWIGKTLTKLENLIKGERCNKPCSDCNADGTLLGNDHSDKWKKIYKLT